LPRSRLPALLPPRFDGRDQPPNVIQPSSATFIIWLRSSRPRSATPATSRPSLREQPVPHLGWPLAAAFACTGLWAPLLRKHQYWAAHVALLASRGAETARRRLTAFEQVAAWTSATAGRGARHRRC
jgi:hypothetical protein